MTFVRDVTAGLVHVRAAEGQARWMVGDTYIVKASGASTGGSLGLMEASIPPGSGPPPHRHTREDEAIYLLSGMLECRNDDEVVHACAGDFVFLPRGAMHSFRNIGVDPARAIIIITPGGFEGMFSEAGVPAQAGQQAPPPDAAEITRIIAAGPRYGVELSAPPPTP